MMLDKRCKENWRRLGLNNLEKLKKHIDDIFARHSHQKDVLEDIYRMVLPDWDRIEKVCGYPESGTEMWEYIWKLFQKFDRKHHPNVMPAGAWMNAGFSVNRSLWPWEVRLTNCSVKFEAGTQGHLQERNIRHAQSEVVHIQP